MQARWLRSHAFWAAAGVLAATSSMVLVNLLAARHFERWDWTTDARYTLSPATVETLATLPEPIDVFVFLGRSDPLLGEVRELLAAYESRAPHLRVEVVDPDRSPARVLALQSRFGVEAGHAEDGRLVTDAAIVVARGDRPWFITHDDIIVYDEETGEARPQLERALTMALRRVLDNERLRVCFTEGHEELSIQDVSPGGLAELSRRLEKENYEVESVDLGPPTPATLEGCRLVVVANPDVALDRGAIEAVSAASSAHTSLLVLTSATLDEASRVEQKGLSAITRSAGITVTDELVVETDPRARLPEGFGETFFALPARHEVTESLFRRGQPELPVLVSLALRLEASDGEAAPLPLLNASADAATLRDVESLAERGVLPALDAWHGKERPVVGFAALRGQARIIVVPAAVAANRNFLQPTLIGGRRFIESAIGWLTTKPVLVDVPSKPGHPAGLALTEASLGEVQRYVLLYMPLTSALIGLWVLYRRRRAPKANRAARGAGERNGGRP